MPTSNKKLGSTIKKYRTAKNYSTQQLANHLNVSVGFINNLEHGKNNVFKLDLLMHLIKELNIPIQELLPDKSLEINKIHITSNKEKLEITLNNKGFDNLDVLKKQLHLIINLFLQTIAECNYNSDAIQIISSHLLNQISYSKKLLNLKK